jgi:CheY-like chemotaxis protein
VRRAAQALLVFRRRQINANGVNDGGVVARPVDLVLTDITMPRLDGFKFLGRAQQPRLRDVMVIMLGAR